MKLQYTQLNEINNKLKCSKGAFEIICSMEVGLLPSSLQESNPLCVCLSFQLVSLLDNEHF